MNGPSTESGPQIPRLATFQALWPWINRTLIIVCSNAIAVLGVLFWGWPSFHLIVIFVVEAVIVLCTDTIKAQFIRRAERIDKNLKNPRPILMIEYGFILFYGFFSLLVFSPLAEDFVMSQTFPAVARLVITELRLPIIGIIVFRSYRTVCDLIDSGVFRKRAVRPLTLDGGGWMLLLFFAVMLAVVVSRNGPNPKGGFFTIVILKTIGECIGSWAEFKRCV